MFVMFRWLPESGRWLVANGKFDDAHYYINQCAEMNNRCKCMAAITPRVLFVHVFTYFVSVSSEVTMMQSFVSLFCRHYWNLSTRAPLTRSTLLLIFSKRQP